MERTCPECRAPAAADQRYCLGCGARVGAPRVDWRAPLRSREASAPAAARPAVAGVALPTPRVAATLLLIVMGFGVVVAGAAGPAVPRSLAAAARGPITIKLPPRPAPPAPAPASSPAPEPAAPEPAASPAPAPEPIVAPAPTPVQEPAAPSTPPDTTTTTPDTPAAPTAPRVKHVFVVALGPGTFDQWFGEQSTVPYLAKELAPQGLLLASYAATSAGELGNEITMISGQRATAQADANCPSYTPVADGDGCVYGPDTYTIPDQLAANGLAWRAYVAGQDTQPCRHPEDGGPDPFATPDRPDDPYVTWRNPFVYFQTIVSSDACATSDVGLAALDADLAAVRSTPAFSWIAPAPADASPQGADAWLRTVLPKILGSRAYKKDGLLAVVPDASGNPDDRTTGALLLSRYAPPSISYDTFDHRSLVKSVDDLFALQYLPGADGRKVKSFVSLLLH